MRNLSFPVALVAAVVTAGCSFQVGGKTDPAVPPPGQPPAAAPAAHPATGPVTTKGIGRVKSVPGATPVTPVTPVNPTPATPAAPAGVPVLAGANLWGTGTPDASGWKGSFFVIPAGTTKVPALSTMTPTGVLFAHQLDVAAKAMTGGFPGIDAARNENFALRWEAPLIVDTESDYAFRVISDDGAIVNIDSTLIVDNDGTHGPTEKTGPVHLVKGTHVISVDYFQGTGGIALQLFCKKAGGTETICPTHLQ